MKFLVTGGTGFLGRRIAIRLLERGHEVRCISRSKVGCPSWLPVEYSEKCEIVQADLTDSTASDRAVEGCDIVIHAASASTGSVPYLFTCNVIGTQNLLSSIEKNRIQKFVHISSLAVYGVQHLKRNDVLNETCPLEQNAHLRDPYTYSKVAQEDLVRDTFAQSETPLVVIRPGVIYGPHRPIITGRVGIQLGSLLIRMGNGKKLPYTYVENCADAIVAAAFAPDANGKVINIIDDSLPSSRQLIRAQKRKSKRPFVLRIPRCMIAPLSWLNEWYSRKSNGQVPMVLSRYKSNAMWKRLTYDNSLAKTVLQWNPKVSLEEGIEKALGSTE